MLVLISIHNSSRRSGVKFGQKMEFGRKKISHVVYNQFDDPLPHIMCIFRSGYNIGIYGKELVVVYMWVHCFWTT